MNTHRLFLLSGLFLCAVSVSGCSGVRNSLGLNKDAPDEFAVITRAPLEIPANIALPPPNLGAPRPQEQPTIAKAQEAVFGEEKEASETISAGEATLLEHVEEQGIDQNIRATVNNETAELDDRNRTVIQKLIKADKSATQASATVVDAKKEHERIQQNIKEGKSVTEGETPTIEQ